MLCTVCVLVVVRPECAGRLDDGTCTCTGLSHSGEADGSVGRQTDGRVSQRGRPRWDGDVSVAVVSSGGDRGSEEIIWRGLAAPSCTNGMGLL
jgi:hypothetical protein